MAANVLSYKRLSEEVPYEICVVFSCATKTSTDAKNKMAETYCHLQRSISYCKRKAYNPSRKVSREDALGVPCAHHMCFEIRTSTRCRAKQRRRAFCLMPALGNASRTCKIIIFCVKLIATRQVEGGKSTLQTNLSALMILTWWKFLQIFWH